MVHPQNSSRWHENSPTFNGQFKNHGPASRQRIFELSNSHNSIQDNMDIFVGNDDESRNTRPPKLSWNSKLVEPQNPWQFPSSEPGTYSSPATVDLDDPFRKLPVETWNGVNSTETPMSLTLLASISGIFCVLCILRIFVQALRASTENGPTRRSSIERRILNIFTTTHQEDNYDAGSTRRLVCTEVSVYNDLPPSYSECSAATGIINKSFEITSEERPPSYSSCIETSRDGNEVVKAHKRYSKEDSQPQTEADLRLHTVDTVCISDAGHTEFEVGTPRTVPQITIDIDNINNVQVTQKNVANVERKPE